MRPTSRATVAASAVHSAAFVTSSRYDQARPPAALMSAAVCRTVAVSTSVATTEAPARASPSAIARPFPCPAPVTSATLPSSTRGAIFSVIDIIFRSSLDAERVGGHPNVVHLATIRSGAAATHCAHASERREATDDRRSEIGSCIRGRRPACDDRGGRRRRRRGRENRWAARLTRAFPPGRAGRGARARSPHRLQRGVLRPPRCRSRASTRCARRTSLEKADGPSPLSLWFAANSKRTNVSLSSDPDRRLRVARRAHVGLPSRGRRALPPTSDAGPSSRGACAHRSAGSVGPVGAPTRAMATTSGTTAGGAIRSCASGS